MSKVQEQHKFTLDLCRFIAFVANEGFLITMGEVARTVDQQAIHFKAGRSKTMRSKHLERLAMDVNIFHPNGTLLTHEELKPMGAKWEALAPGINVWGGSWKSFKDSGHFQRGK